MHRRFLLLVSAVGLAQAGCTAVSHEPVNLDLRKQEIRRYVESGQYDRDIATVAAQARAWIEQRAAKRGAGERLTVVFDLDDTLLSVRPYFDAYNFGYSASSWQAWIDSGNAPAIEPVRELYALVRRLHVDVIFLTTRDERQRAGTEKNLRVIDCGDYAALLCEPDGSKETAAAYKSAQRKRLAGEGRVIIANIGDQESDLAGGSAERTFKLPNPFYLTP